jgi:hypothetical protein
MALSESLVEHIRKLNELESVQHELKRQAALKKIKLLRQTARLQEQNKKQLETF